MSLEQTAPAIEPLEATLRRFAAEEAAKRRDWQAIVIVCLAIIGGIVWCVRLEGRVNNQDAQIVDAKDRNTKQAEDTTRRLERIEDKLDRLQEKTK